MSGYWLNSVVCGDCPTCKVALLPAISRESLQRGMFNPSQGDLWCHVCKRVWRPAPRTKDVDLGKVPLDGPREVRELRPSPHEPIVARVEPDGTVTLDVPTKATLTMGEVRALSEALIWLGRGAQGRQEVLRGALRWVFTKSPDGTASVTYLDETRPLAMYVVGVKRVGYTDCAACAGVIRERTIGYRPVTRPWENSRVQWKELRFCPTCVDAGGVATVRKGLRVIKGGA